MFSKVSKNIAIAGAGLAFNSYCMFKAVKANAQWNQYLETLSPEEHEKMRARDWYLKKNGNFFGSGIIVGEVVEMNLYKAKSENEKERILMQYRWDQLKKIKY